MFFSAILSSTKITPKLWPVTNGAWQIRLPLPWELTSVNIFLFQRKEDYMLLDTGICTEESLLSLELSLQSLGLSWDSIGEILISHLHPDHLGAAAEIRKRSGAPIRMNPRESGYVQPLRPDQQFFQETGSFLVKHGFPRSDIDTLRNQALKTTEIVERFVSDGDLLPGERLPFHGGTLETILAPGHSPGQLCFHYPKERVLYSMDAILPHTTPNIGLHWFYPSNALKDYFETLNTLEQLDIDLIIPSHGRPFQGHRAWIKKTREHHFKRCEKIYARISDKPLNGYEVSELIWPRDLNLSNRRFALAEALAHLEYMAQLERIKIRSVDGITCWMK